MLLDGKKLLVTGVLTDDSIAFAIARVAQEAGAEIVLTGFGRGRSLTERVARKLPTTPDVLELDVNKPEDIEAVAAEVTNRWGRLDGLVHAIGFAPNDALGGNFPTPRGRAWRPPSRPLRTRSRPLLPECSNRSRGPVPRRW